LEFLRALGVDFRLVIIQAIGFLILLYLLKRFLFGKILALLQARKEEIQSTYAHAEKDRTEATRLKRDYEKRLAEAEEEAERKLNQAVQEAKKIGAEIIEKTRQEAEVIKLKAQETMELERKKAVAEIRDQVVNLSMLASQRLIQQSLNQETAERLVNELIKEVEGLPFRRSNGAMEGLR
jgi:F-type H+-transporting ATPase subunit b